MGRRVRIGRFPDGVVRVRTTLAGFDPLTANVSDPNQVSFDSDAPGFTQLHQVGMATLNTTVRIYSRWPGFYDGIGTTVPFVSLGYYPYIDVRRFQSNVAYDDHAHKGWWTLPASPPQPHTDRGEPQSLWVTSLRCQVYPSQFTVGDVFGGSGGTFVYVIYKEQAI